MKMTMKANYLNKDSKAGFKDPNKTYYNVLLMQGLDTLSLNCPVDVYNSLSTVKQMDEVNVELEYNTNYRSLRVLSISK